MKTITYRDDAGKEIMSVACSSGDVLWVPPGKTISDAEHISHDEFNKKIAETKLKEKSNPKEPTIKDLMMEIEKLKANVQHTPKP